MCYMHVAQLRESTIAHVTLKTRERDVLVVSSFCCCYHFPMHFMQNRLLFFSFIQDLYVEWVSIIIAIIYCLWCFLSHFSCTYFMVINYGILYSLSNLAALDKISHTKIKKKIIFDNRFSIYYNQLHLTCTYKTRERGRERRNFFLVVVVASVLEYLSLPREKTCDEHNTFSIFSDFSFSTQFSLFVAFTQFTSDVYALVQCG